MTKHIPTASIVATPFAGAMEFRLAMRELASAVSIITAGQGKKRRGLTVTALCSLSVEPPSLIVCVNKATEGHKAILQHGSFCVNVLAAEHRLFADSFAGRTGRRGIERFSEGEWTSLVTGAPVLAGAIAVLDCEIINFLDHGTHTVFIGAVRAARSEPNRRALVYRAGDYQGV
ncbi:flavin reductase family protein [Microvirga sp. BT688]|uniref:flavin reductase family protein n=1 Tax=Microvirga sp. TaxID=1873136 RepID=UPI0016890818|nr:flavin reductase family protein [Microvirga sp.]MBD2750542.1 flavin reductase family protein [Microvirga sp.]